MDDPYKDEGVKGAVELESKSFIRPSSSHWGETAVFSMKSDRSLRLCIDYRKLNERTIKN